MQQILQILPPGIAQLKTKTNFGKPSGFAKLVFVDIQVMATAHRANICALHLTNSRENQFWKNRWLFQNWFWCEIVQRKGQTLARFAIAIT